VYDFVKNFLEIQVYYLKPEHLSPLLSLISARKTLLVRYEHPAKCVLSFLQYFITYKKQIFRKQGTIFKEILLQSLYITWKLKRERDKPVSE